MPRKPRYVLPGQPHHVTQRGNNRSAIFASSVDFLAFRNHLAVASRRYECAVHAYAFMTNHVHLLISPQSVNGLAHLMQSLGRVYVRYFNKKYTRTGTLFEGRYHSSAIDTESYLLACYRYVELNPVRAKLVLRASEYSWSSNRSNAFGQRDDLVTPHVLYSRLGEDSRARQEAYRALFNAGLDEHTLREIRLAGKYGTPLGGEAFRQRFEAS
jgi:putative transposase